MLKLERLEVFGLEPVSLEVGKGECLAIEGPSGSGKTLLLRAIADLDLTSGDVSLDGTDRFAMSGPEWRRRVRYAAAEPGWWGVAPREHFHDLSSAEALVRQLGLEPAILDRPVTELSTGERQRLALARAIEDSPVILLLDEPTGALDAKATARVEKLLKRELKAGHAIVLVSHAAEQVKRLATRRMVIRNHRLRDASP